MWCLIYFFKALFYETEYEILLNSKIKEIDYNRLLPKQRKRLKYLKNEEKKGILNWEQTKEKEALEDIAKNKNIYVDKLKWDLSSNGGYTANTEEFRRYNFRNKEYNILISTNEKYRFELTFEDIEQFMNKRSKIIQDGYRSITFSSQRRIQHQPSKEYIGGYSDTKGNIVLFTDNEKFLDDFIAHEGAHNIELGKKLMSSDEHYRELAIKDMVERKNGNIKITKKPKGLNVQSEDKLWISEYAEKPINSKAEEFIEDWADSVSAYENQREWFRKNYPHRFKYIDAVFKEYERTGKIVIPPRGVTI